MDLQGVHTANTIVARSSAAVPPTPDPNTYIEVADPEASPVTDLVLKKVHAGRRRERYYGPPEIDKRMPQAP